MSSHKPNGIANRISHAKRMQRRARSSARLSVAMKTYKSTFWDAFAYDPARWHRDWAGQRPGACYR